MAEETENACCGGANTLVLACSGASNVGQVSNSIMIELDKKGIAKGYCLAGLGAELSGFVESAKSAETIQGKRQDR